jgi:hypothetical protein
MLGIMKLIERVYKMEVLNPKINEDWEQKAEWGNADWARGLVTESLMRIGKCGNGRMVEWVLIVWDSCYGTE